jgi:hypothetical protein
VTIKIFGFLFIVLGAAVAIPAVLGLVGIGLMRHAPDVLVAVGAVALVGLPARGLRWTAKEAKRPSAVATGVAMMGWSLVVLICMPLYFPGEREDALSLGFSAIEPWTNGQVNADMGRSVHRWMPAIGGSRPVPEAASTVLPPPPPPPARRSAPEVPAQRAPAQADEVILPTEGKGSLKVPVTLEGPRGQHEVTMLFDTGATLTTLDRATLKKIGVRIPADAPRLTMQTAAGPQTTSIVAVDRLWVGGLEVEGVTVSVCDPCATGGSVGLLGNNVSERFLVTVDGARSEIALEPRPENTDRGADIGPWIELEAEGTRWPDGRSEVVIEAENRSRRWVDSVKVAIRCKQTRYAEIRDISPGQIGRVEVSVDAEADCSSFQVELVRAEW